VGLPPRASMAFPASAYSFRHHQIWVLAGRLQFSEGPRVHELSHFTRGMRGLTG